MSGKRQPPQAVSLQSAARLSANVALEVSDLASELAGREILSAPNSPSDGVCVAFIVENGAPIELLEFTDPTIRIGVKTRLGVQIVPADTAAHPRDTQQFTPTSANFPRTVVAGTQRTNG
jgi:hypothetical protein